MAGYQTIEALRPILRRGPPAAPMVDRALVRPEAPFQSRRGVKPPPHIIAKMVARRSRGEPLNSIAKTFGVSRPTVVRHTRHVPPPAGGWANCWSGGSREQPVIREEFVRRLRRAEFTWPEVEAECGCNVTTIRVRLGLKAQRPKHNDAFGVVRRRVCRVAGVPSNEVWPTTADRRGPTVIALIRAIVFWLAKHRFGLPLAEIGRRLGGFHYTTVLNGIRRVEAVIASAGIEREATVGRLTRAVMRAEFPKGAPC